MCVNDVHVLCFFLDGICYILSSERSVCVWFSDSGYLIYVPPERK